ncbi:MAG TPA: helix-hairpin-helix domain-containing protein [Natrialbaceae archaeon]|nr:helix-hairpin-helix domain-containing protein [Natrialbaceae archaeon]
MKAICENELVLDCTDYKAIDSGVVLLGDEEGSDVVAFVPNEKLEYVLPDDVVEREYERLGLPAPTIRSPEELEPRLETFAEEIDDLREHLDRQVEDLIDEDATFEEDADPERQERLRERRRTIDRLLEGVRQRGQQLRQLSTAGTERETATETEGEGAAEEADEERTATEAEGEAPADPEDPALEAGSTTEERLASLESEMDARLGAIEAQLQELTAGGEEEDDIPIEPGIVQGLGSTYASRLRDAGIESVGALADRTPEEIAESAEVSENRATTWIDLATELLEEERTAT